MPFSLFTSQFSILNPLLLPFCYKIFCFISQMCLSTSLICFFISFLCLCLLATAPWPFIFALFYRKIAFPFNICAFLLASAYWTFPICLLVQYRCPFFRKQYFSLSHDFVLFSHNCALSFLFVPFSNCYRLLTFILCVLMQYKCCFHETYCPTSMPFFFTIVSVYFTFFAFFWFFSVSCALPCIY